MNVEACQQTKSIIEKNVKEHGRQKVVEAIEKEMHDAKSYMSNTEFEGFLAVMNFAKNPNKHPLHALVTNTKVFTDYQEGSVIAVNASYCEEK